MSEIFNICAHVLLVPRYRGIYRETYLGSPNFQAFIAIYLRYGTARFSGIYRKEYRDKLGQGNGAFTDVHVDTQCAECTRAGRRQDTTTH